MKDEICYYSVKIDCNGDKCPNENCVVYPEVVGEGDTKVGILGEAPYSEECESNRPFIGSSGKVIREILDLESFTYYIFNTLSCLTYVDGETMKPSQMEQEDYESRFTMCETHREKILDMLDDGSVIVAFGKFAIHAMFGDWKKKASTIPDFLEHNGKTFIVYSVYHPAYSMYRPSMRPKFDEMLSETGVFDFEFQEIVDEVVDEKYIL